MSSFGQVSNNEVIKFELINQMLIFLDDIEISNSIIIVIFFLIIQNYIY
jgi:hypothetical protein